jgi:hypothetical protein
MLTHPQAGGKNTIGPAFGEYEIYNQIETKTLSITS